MAMIAVAIIVPNFGPSLQMTRLYHILLIFLAPLCVRGGEVLYTFLHPHAQKHSKKSHSKRGNGKGALALVLVVLVPYFLFQTEFVYEITGDYSTSIPLSRYRTTLDAYFHMGLFDERDVFGASWLSQYLDPNHTTVYSDLNSKFQVLASYGRIHDPYARIELISNATAMHNGTAYLTRTNVVYGIIRGRDTFFNTSEISPILNNMSQIYSNGVSRIYKHQ